MTIYRFNIDGDKDVEAIAVSLTLLASKIFHDRFPGPIQHEGWHAAMATLVRVLTEHVRSAQEDQPGPRPPHVA
jgi:hypothetical protein